MKKHALLKCILALSTLLFVNQSAYATCDVIGAPGSAANGGDIVVCSAAETNGYLGTANGDEVSIPSGATVSGAADPGANDNTIVTADGDDTILITGGSVTSDSDAVNGGNGADTITMDSGSITAVSDGIRGNDGNDTITINGGSITTTNDEAIEGDNGDDIITINGGTITPDDDAILGNDGNDTITVNGGTITSGADAILGDDGNDTITVNAGSIVGDSDGIRGDDGADTITINGGSVTGTLDQAIESDDGDDIITLNGGTLTGGSDGIIGEAGNDTITINGGTITAPNAIDGGSNDDTVILANDANISGDILGGADTDTLRFALAVPEAELATLQAELAIATATPTAPGSIVINGNTYNWDEFEVIEDNLRVLNIAPVPTLQEWALYLLIALLALTSFRLRRKTGETRSF